MSNELTLNTGFYRATLVGFEKIRELTTKEWREVGNVLKQVDEARQWMIGDWLIDGKKEYGDGLYSTASGILGMEEGYLRQTKWVADRFKLCDRSYNLSWRHHLELASLKTVVTDENGKMRWGDEHDMDKAQEFLQKAEREKLSVSVLREIVREYIVNTENLFRLANEPEKFKIVYADPPWKYNDEQDTNLLGGAVKHYNTMSIDELCLMPVRNLTAKNAVLFIWVTVPIIDQVFRVIEAWGFKYKTHFVWDKVKHNMGHYSSVRHELLFLCTKGSCTPEVVKLFDSVQVIERTDWHSEKPTEFKDIIDTLYPSGKAVELFARDTSKNNGRWYFFGNEIN